MATKVYLYTPQRTKTGGSPPDTVLCHTQDDYIEELVGLLRQRLMNRQWTQVSFIASICEIKSYHYLMNYSDSYPFVIVTVAFQSFLFPVFLVWNLEFKFIIISACNICIGLIWIILYRRYYDTNIHELQLDKAVDIIDRDCSFVGSQRRLAETKVRSTNNNMKFKRKYQTLGHRKIPLTVSSIL